MLFHDILGQDKVKSQLMQMVASGRIGHALLFAGGEGTGALPMALAFAQYIHCTGQKTTEACGTCPSCFKYQKLGHPDLHFVFPVVKRDSNHTNPISSEVLQPWRTLLLNTPYFNLQQWINVLGYQKQAMIYTGESQEIIRKLSMKTFEAEHKIMIIWLPEKMNNTASNRLLKILEEPPMGTIFLLVSETPADILPTILSRTQTIRIPPIDNEAMTQKLIAKYNLGADEAKNIAAAAMGNFVAACETAELREESQIYFQLFTGMMRACYARKVPEMNELVEKILKLSRENQKNFLIYALKMLRENFIMNIKDSRLVYLTAEEQNFSLRFSPFIHEGNIFQLSDEFNLAIAHIEHNGNGRIIMTDLLLKLTILLLTPRP